MDTIHEVRTLTDWSKRFIAMIGVAMVFFQMYTAFFGKPAFSDGAA